VEQYLRCQIFSTFSSL